MRRIKNYHQFTQRHRVNENLNLQDIKNGLMDLAKKMKSGISKKAAMTSLAILLTSAAVSGQESASIKNIADSVGVKTPCGYTRIDVLQTNCSSWTIMDDLGGQTDANGDVWFPAIGFYTVKKGDTIFSLSRLFKIDPNVLMADNNITDPTQLRIGQVLKISLIVFGNLDEIDNWGKDPNTQSDTGRYWSENKFENDPNTSNKVIYRVKKGESAYQIAKKLGITVDELMNYMGPDVTDPAQIKELQEIHLPAHLAQKLMGEEEVKGTTTYKVKEGDTFRKIADEFGTSVETLLKINNRFGAQGPNIKLDMGEIIYVPAN